MALPTLIDSLEAVAEPFRSEYKATADGKFLLDTVPHESGWALENVTALKVTVGKERNRANDAEKKVKAYASFDGLDPEQVKTSLTRLTELEALDPAKEADKIAETKYKNRLDDLVKQHKTKEETLTSALQQRDTKLQKLIVDSEITNVLAKHAPNSVELLSPHVSKFVRVREVNGDFVREVVDAEGNPRIGDAHGTPMSVEQLVLEMRDKPAFSLAFPSSGTTGSGTQPNGSNKPAGNAQRRSMMTDKEKSAYTREHGLAKFKALPE